MADVLSKGEPLPKLENVIKTYGLFFRGKSLSVANCAALKGVYPFVCDRECSAAFETSEMYNPELRDPTFLMKLGLACSGRGGSNVKAKADFAFVMNALRVARLTGEIPKDEKLSVNRIVGRDKKSPGMLHVLPKKQDLVEYIYHEAFLMDQTMQSAVETFKTPLSIMENFATSGANGLVASHWTSSCFSEGMAKAFGVEVDRYRDGVDAKAKAMIDVVWPVWAGDFDNEITELAVQDAQNSSAGFLWHTYLNETSAQVGTNYRAFVALCTGVPEGGPNLKAEAAPPLPDSDELQKLQGQLKQLRRKTVKFIHLPEVGAASGALTIAPMCSCGRTCCRSGKGWATHCCSQCTRDTHTDNCEKREREGRHRELFCAPRHTAPASTLPGGFFFHKSEEFARSCACFLRRVRTSHRHRRHRPIAKSERMSNARFCARYMMESYAYVPCGVRANLCLRAPRIWVGLHVLWKPPHVLCSSRCNVSEWMLSIGAQTLFHAGSATPFACGRGGGTRTLRRRYGSAALRSTFERGSSRTYEIVGPGT